MHNLPESVRESILARPIVTTHRATILQRLGVRWFRRTYQHSLGVAQPTMHWFVQPGERPFRTQPRDGRGRFLSKAWLAEAELFTATDRAWFRAPLSQEVA